ncbi:hypothetical protein APT63_13210 [Pseudomonas sp. 22-AL-CL-001]|nr:hypothetical protein APT63_13210 [Pseudomonas monteilii]
MFVFVAEHTALLLKQFMQGRHAQFEAGRVNVYDRLRSILYVHTVSTQSGIAKNELMSCAWRRTCSISLEWHFCLIMYAVIPSGLLKFCYNKT